MNKPKKKKHKRPGAQIKNSPDLLMAREFITLRFISEKPRTTQQIRDDRLGSTVFKNKELKRFREQGLIKMIKEGSKYPWKITEKGKKRIKDLRFR